MVAEDSPATDVAPDSGDLSKNRSIQQNRIAAKTSVGRKNDLWAEPLIVLNHAVQCCRTHEGLIGQHDQRSLRVGTDGAYPHAQRTPHAFLVRLVHDDPDPLTGNLLPDLVRGMTQNQNNLS